jgi:hypothetical protein
VSQAQRIPRECDHADAARRHAFVRALHMPSPQNDKMAEAAACVATTRRVEPDIRVLLKILVG